MRSETMDSEPAISFPTDAHDLLLEAEKGAWFRHRNLKIEALLRAYPFEGPFYETGAGNGAVSAYLQGRGFEIVAIEPLAAGAANCRKQGIRTVYEATLEQLELPAESVGAIGAFDVLEHLERPELLLKEAARVLRPGGLFFVTVPAHQFLWSEIDEFSGHYRRYGRGTLRSLFQQNEFEPLKSGYFMNLLVAPAFLSRVVPEFLGRRREDRAAREQTTAVLAKSRPLALLLSAERALRLDECLPFGTSLFGVFRRQLR